MGINQNKTQENKTQAHRIESCEYCGKHFESRDFGNVIKKKYCGLKCRRDNNILNSLMRRKNKLKKT